MRVKRWRTYLETIEDVLDWEVRRERNLVTHFSINYRTFRSGRWLEVCRYDTCHGYLHIHRQWRKPSEQAQDLTAKRIGVGNYHMALAAASRDLENNWKRYKQLSLAQNRGETIE